MDRMRTAESFLLLARKLTASTYMFTILYPCMSFGVVHITSGLSRWNHGSTVLPYWKGSNEREVLNADVCAPVQWLSTRCYICVICDSRWAV